MMNIRYSSDIPNSTYFTATDVEPVVNPDGSITVYQGEGTRRSWGRPQVTSTIVLDDCDLVAIHVGFSHKHRGSQGWYFFTTDGTTTRRITWRHLPDEQRQRVLDNLRQAPAWAKMPGKLSKDYVKPSMATMTSYKLVRMDGERRMLSLYDGSTEYSIGKRLVEKARDEHRGGYYSHPTIEQVKRLWAAGNLVPDRCIVEGAVYALIECEIAGTIVRYDNGKLSSTYLTPVRIVETFVHEPAAVAA